MKYVVIIALAFLAFIIIMSFIHEIQINRIKHKEIMKDKEIELYKAKNSIP